MTRHTTASAAKILNKAFRNFMLPQYIRCRNAHLADGILTTPRDSAAQAGKWGHYVWSVAFQDQLWNDEDERRRLSHDNAHLRHRYRKDRFSPGWPEQGR